MSDGVSKSEFLSWQTDPTTTPIQGSELYDYYSSMRVLHMGLWTGKLLIMGIIGTSIVLFIILTLKIKGRFKHMISSEVIESNNKSTEQTVLEILNSTLQNCVVPEKTNMATSLPCSPDHSMSYFYHPHPLEVSNEPYQCGSMILDYNSMSSPEELGFFPYRRDPYENTHRCNCRSRYEDSYKFTRAHSWPNFNHALMNDDNSPQSQSNAWTSQYIGVSQHSLPYHSTGFQAVEPVKSTSQRRIYDATTPSTANTHSSKLSNHESLWHPIVHREVVKKRRRHKHRKSSRTRLHGAEI